MSSSYLTKHLSKLSLAINLTLTALLWLYCISTNDPTLFFIIQSYVLISMNTAKIVITVICGAWIVRSITAYEARVIQFIQADLLKGILNELKSSREQRTGDSRDAMEDSMKIDLEKI